MCLVHYFPMCPPPPPPPPTITQGGLHRDPLRKNLNKHRSPLPIRQHSGSSSMPKGEGKSDAGDDNAQADQEKSFVKVIQKTEKVVAAPPYYCRWRMFRSLWGQHNVMPHIRTKLGPTSRSCTLPGPSFSWRPTHLRAGVAWWLECWARNEQTWIQIPTHNRSRACSQSEMDLNNPFRPGSPEGARPFPSSRTCPAKSKQRPDRQTLACSYSNSLGLQW